MEFGVVIGNFFLDDASIVVMVVKGLPTMYHKVTYFFL